MKLSGYRTYISAGAALVAEAVGIASSNMDAIAHYIPAQYAHISAMALTFLAMVFRSMANQKIQSAYNKGLEEGAGIKQHIQDIE